MDIDETKLKDLFTGIYSDITLIFKDEIHEEVMNVHRSILSIRQPNYFNTLFSHNMNKNTIPINVWDVYTAYDCIANYFYKVDINKGNLKPSVHFGIPFDPDLNALLDITHKIGFSGQLPLIYVLELCLVFLTN